MKITIGIESCDFTRGSQNRSDHVLRGRYFIDYHTSINNVIKRILPRVMVYIRMGNRVTSDVWILRTAEVVARNCICKFRTNFVQQFINTTIILPKTKWLYLPCFQINEKVLIFCAYGIPKITAGAKWFNVLSKDLAILMDKIYSFMWVRNRNKP